MKGVRWIGLAKVVPLNNETLGDARGAYVNAMAFANSKVEFRRKVKVGLAKIGVELKRLENPEPLKDRTRKFRVDKHILKISKRLSSKTSEVEFSTFHTYD